MRRTTSTSVVVTPIIDTEAGQTRITRAIQEADLAAATTPRRRHRRTVAPAIETQETPAAESVTPEALQYEEPALDTSHIQEYATAEWTEEVGTTDTAMAEVAEQAQPATETTASTSFQAKVEALLAIASEGPEAVAEAIRAGRIQIRTPKMARTARTTPGAPRVYKLSFEIAESVRARREAGETIAALAESTGVHTSTIMHIIARRIYKKAKVAA